jgi:recombination associated protein RdgC
LVVEASTATKAENFMALLRESLGSLKVRYPLTEDAPAPLMTGWLTGDLPVPEGFVVEDECELRGADSDGVVRCRREDLASQEITALANGGRRVTRLAMSWRDRLAFVLKEDLSLASVAMLDVLAEQAAEVEAESEAERMDADFALMTGEFRELFAALLDAFGGEQAQESGDDAARAA